MAKGNTRRWAARAAGRPPVPNFTVVSGANTTTNIAVAGIHKEDILLSVLEFDFGGTAITDRVAETSVTSDGNVQLTTTNTTGHKLVIVWLSVRV